MAKPVKGLERKLQIAWWAIEKTHREYARLNGGYMDYGVIMALCEFLQEDPSELCPYIEAERARGVNRRIWWYISDDQYKKLRKRVMNA